MVCKASLTKSSRLSGSASNIPSIRINFLLLSFEQLRFRRPEPIKMVSGTSTHSNANAIDFPVGSGSAEGGGGINGQLKIAIRLVAGNNAGYHSRGRNLRELATHGIRSATSERYGTCQCQHRAPSGR